MPPTQHRPPDRRPDPPPPPPQRRDREPDDSLVVLPLLGGGEARVRRSHVSVVTPGLGHSSAPYSVVHVCGSALAVALTPDVVSARVFGDLVERKS